MGRPIKSIYFGNRNTDSVGGEALATTSGNLTVAFSGNIGYGYYSANVAASIAAPTVTGGTTAIVDSVYLHANGAIKSVHVSNAGTGYTSAPAITFTGANVATATGGTASVLASSTTSNSIASNAWVAGDTVGRTNGDVIKQTGGRTYRVATSGGTGKCKLVTTANPAAEGEMTITATFEDNSTFSVARLTKNLAYDADGNAYRWADYSGDQPAFATASNSTVPVTVSISNV